MADLRTHECPLCTLEFEDGWACHTSCPMATGCGMIKCPRCNYEFVEESRIVSFFRGLFGGNSDEARHN